MNLEPIIQEVFIEFGLSEICELRKVAVVTGASGQLGPIWCETLEEMKIDVFKMDLPDCDVSDLVKCQLYRDICLREHGVPAVIILNAAIDNPPGSEASFHGNLGRILDVNILGATNVVRCFLPDMIRNRGGIIIGITSIMGFIGADWRNYQPGWEKPVGYNLSKAALQQYVRSLTVQYGRYGIRACCIGFGPYNGGKLDKEFLGKFLKNVPLGRPVSKESAKAALRFALECDEFAGQTAMVEGGYLSI